MTAKGDVVGRDMKSKRSASLDVNSTHRGLLRDREMSIDIPCTKYPENQEELQQHHHSIIKSGWLDKTPPKVGRFQRRWVTLTSDYLRYYQNKKEVYSKRMVSLSCASGVVRVGGERFELITQGRTFLFRAASNQQREDWLSCLWKVLGSLRDRSTVCVHSDPSAVSVEGQLEMTSPRTRLYAVIADGRLYLFKTQQEYLHGIGITDINLSGASVKEAAKSFSLTTPYRTFSFVVDSEAECQRWCSGLSVCENIAQSTASAKNANVELTQLCEACGTVRMTRTVGDQRVMCDFCAGSVASEVKPAASHSGYLYKVASSTRLITEHKPRTDFSQRWCCLRDGVFSYYKSEQSSSKCGSMNMSDIVCLSLKKPGSHGFEHTFELYTDGGRLYLFGAEDVNTIKKWVETVAMAVLPPPLRDVCGVCDRLGRLRCTEGSSGIGWFCLSDSNLQILLQDSVQNVDLRKLHTLSVCSESEVVLGWRGGCVHLQAERRLPFPGWLSSIRLASGAGDQQLHRQQLTESGIPIIVERCLDHVTRDGLMSPGIYRKCGVNSKVSTLLENFRLDARSVCVTEEFGVDDVANTLKRYFRELKKGVFDGEENINTWLTITDMMDSCERTNRYQHLLATLPEVNRDTLKALFNHLYCVQSLSDVNHMSVRNLGIVFGPTLFQMDGTDSRTSGVVEDMIQSYCAIFNVQEAELQKQLDATSLILNKLSDQMSTVHSPSYTICAIYLERKEEGAELLMQVGGNITAEKLVSEVLEKRGIQSAAGETWSCFEVEEEEQMECELHYQEKVLPVYYSLGPQSHLLVKKNHYSSDYANYLRGKIEVCKVGTLQVCEVKGDKSKSFCSRVCELSAGTFKLYREAQGSSCDQEWPVHELKVYQGYRSKLQAPTPWSLTVLYDKQQWCFCCENEDQFVEWSATFMSLQHGRNLGREE